MHVVDGAREIDEVAQVMLLVDHDRRGAPQRVDVVAQAVPVIGRHQIGSPVERDDETGRREISDQTICLS